MAQIIAIANQKGGVGKPQLPSTRSFSCSIKNVYC